MADNTIDTLSLEISSSASQANKALDNLAKKLLNVNKALQSVNTGGLSDYVRDMEKISASIKGLNGIKVNIPNLSGLSKQLEKLGKVDFSKLTSSTQSLNDLASGLQDLSGLQNISIPKLDTKNINSVVRAVEKLKGIESGEMPQIADGLKKISDSILNLNNVKLEDTGIEQITKLVRALGGLSKVDMGKFNPYSFNSITSSIGALADVPDVSNRLNRFVSSLAKLANAGEKTGQVSSSIAQLGVQLRKAIINISKVGNVSDSVNLFVQSIGRLASAGNKTGQTAGRLRTLASETLEFFNVMKDAPEISENVIRMTEALAQLASAGGKVGTATKTVSSSFSQLSSKAKLAANTIKKTFSSILSLIKKVGSGVLNASKSIISSFTKIGNSSGGLKTASFNLGTLLKTAIGFRAVQGLLSFGKSAIDLGSNITEVENVVDVSFGSMADKAYEFASTATEQFGLSELAAKQYSGTMMAMLNSSGVAQDAAAEMSTTLAGLAGDLASFYNLDTDIAFQKIRAGISGETEPLKQLGINMSVANLQAYALTQGITKSYQAMSQAEQATLRYNYLMSVTGQQQGDFARTSGRLCAA